MASAIAPTNLTKGSGPTHSIAIDATTNRNNSAGYDYDANGNLTQMPLMTMTYDVANRMVSPRHSKAGNQIYGYNHAMQRAPKSGPDGVSNGNTVTYYLYGMSGERLMEFQETCTSGACTSYTENQRWIYVAGRKMFSKTGSTLKAITPNRLASETQGTPPADTTDYFATDRRDDTGLDYAMNRYDSPTMGRSTTADPYAGSASPTVPETWNRYSYVNNNSVSATDPTGHFLELFSGPGAVRVLCAMDPFAALSTTASACGNSPFSEEMWSSMGPWDPISAVPNPLPLLQRRTAEERKRKELDIRDDFARTFLRENRRNVFGYFEHTIRIQWRGERSCLQWFRVNGIAGDALSGSIPLIE